MNGNDDYKHDSDSDDDAPPPTSTGGRGEDPERTERIRQMVAASSASNVMADDQVMNFVMSMAEKNQQMEDGVTPTGQRQRQRMAAAAVSDDDSNNSNGSDLDTSYNQNNARARRYGGGRTADEYPPGEAYAGDEGMDEIPSYDPKEDDGALSFNRLCCVACALVIGMVATSILILVFVVIADGEGGKAHSTYSGFDGMVLPFAPDNLQDLCDLEALKSYQGVLECREPCMRAACCWEHGDDGGEPICWESHPLECAPYESCVNLLSSGNSNGGGSQLDRPTSVVPRATEGVNSCSSATSVDQVLSCENACRLGECCWKDTASSPCKTDPNCGDYKPCEIINEGGSAAGSGSTSINSNALNNNGIQEAPTNLEEVCTEQSIEACEEVCEKATCCWKLATHTYMGPLGEPITESVLGSCAQQNPQICKGYKPCMNIPKDDPDFSTVTIPAAPTTLEDTCASSLEGACTDACNKAPCCWQLATHTFTGPLGEVVEESVQGACSHRDECVGYEPCKAIPAATTQAAGTTPAPTVAPVTSVPEVTFAAETNLESVCNAAMDGVCRDTCNQAQCCWKLSTTTYTGPLGEPVTESVLGTCAHLDGCEAYKACKQLPEATASHVHDITPAPATLNATCTNALDGACRDTCNQAPCCWMLATTTTQGAHGESISQTTFGSCSHDHRVECAGYAPCTFLPEATNPVPELTTTAHINIPAAPANLEEKCSPPDGTNEFDQIDDMGLCTQYCNAATCCWRKSTNTFVGPSGVPITESVQGACADQPECDAYEPCSILDVDVFSPHSPGLTPAPAPSSPAPTTPPPFSDTTEYTEDVIFDVCYNHEGTALCEQVCAPGSCCYKSDETCPSDGSVSCAKYEPCQVLLQADGNGVASAGETACADLTDLTPCVEFCSKGTCCFTQDMSKACEVVAPETVCLDFNPCEVLYKGSNNP